MDSTTICLERKFVALKQKQPDLKELCKKIKLYLGFAKYQKLNESVNIFRCRIPFTSKFEV